MHNDAIEAIANNKIRQRLLCAYCVIRKRSDSIIYLLPRQKNTDQSFTVSWNDLCLETKV